MWKWLGVPLTALRSNVPLYCKKATLMLPFKSIMEEYKAGKTCLAMMLRDYVDPIVRKTVMGIRTGRYLKESSAEGLEV